MTKLLPPKPQAALLQRAQSQHPKKLGHVSFHIKYLAAHAKVRPKFRYGTKGQPKELGTAAMSRMAIYGIKRFDFRVACPLHALDRKSVV